MTRITLEIDGMQELRAALRMYGERLEQAVSMAVEATALEVRGDIVKRIQRGPKTGRVYRRGNILHQASAPGQAPATDTGRLASSIVYERLSPMLATVGSNIVYAAMLEFGTRRILPRPAWVPAVEAARPKLQQRVANAIARASR